MMRILLVLALASGCHRGGGDKVDKLGSDVKQRGSYSLGYQLGTTLQNQDVAVDLPAYIAGLREALAGKPAQVSADELQTAMMQLRGKAIAAQQKKARDDADKSRAAGAAFRESNKHRPGVTTLASGLQYRVLQEGSGNRPKSDSNVTVHYRSAFVDGTELASSFKKGQPITVSLAHVIRGWREVLPLMKEGAKWELVVPPELAYGRRGSTGIGPDTTLVFEVALLKINPAQVQASR